jgi:threonine dehydrogenase-like Zn-dependent dehydrogenase
MGTFASASRTTGTNAARDAAINAIAATLNGGSVRIYSGTAPANADAALSGNTLLAQATLNATAFGAASSGVVTANSITADSSADATGTPTFFRLLTSGGTVVYQGTAGASGQELNLADLSSGQILAGGSVTVTSLTMTQAASYA